MPQPPYPLISTASHRRPRYGLLMLAGIALAAAGVAAALLLRPDGALPAKTDAASTAALTMPSAVTAAVTRPASVCITCGTVETVSSNAVETGGKPGSAYQMQVRMDDGSLRSFISPTRLPPGAAVRVDGDTVRAARSGG